MSSPWLWWWHSIVEVRWQIHGESNGDLDKDDDWDDAITLLSGRDTIDGFFLECQCDELGSYTDVCATATGKCSCLPNFKGRTCNQCADGYYGYPNCRGARNYEYIYWWYFDYVLIISLHAPANFNIDRTSHWSTFEAKWYF